MKVSYHSIGVLGQVLVVAFALLGAAADGTAAHDEDVNGGEDSIKLNTSRNLRGGSGDIGSTVTTDEELLSSVHRNLVGTPVVQAAETILPGGQTPIEWTINAVVHSGLCGASTSNIKTAKWTGVENASKEIQWNSVTVSGGTGFPCTYERASSTATFITHYLGDGFGVMPTHVSLPMYTNMKKFTIQHKEPALCAGTTSAVTSWYGKPCDTNNNAATMIEWQYMESTTVGANVIIHCLGTPQWRRGYMGNGQGTADVPQYPNQSAVPWPSPIYPRLHCGVPKQWIITLAPTVVDSMYCHSIIVAALLLVSHGFPYHDVTADVVPAHNAGSVC